MDEKGNRDWKCLRYQGGLVRTRGASGQCISSYPAGGGVRKCTTYRCEIKKRKLRLARLKEVGIWDLVAKERVTVTVAMEKPILQG